MNLLPQTTLCRPFSNPTSNHTSPSIPKSKKPFPQLLCKNFAISHQNFSFPLMTRSKTAKDLVWNIKHNTVGSPGQRRQVTQILRIQISLSKFKLIIDSNRPFETTLFSSQIKHLSSVDTLEIIFDQKLACINKGLRALNIYLPHLKKLTNLYLTFSASEFPHSKFFQQLFQSIKTLRDLTSLSLKFMSPINLPDACLDLLTFHFCKLTQLRSLAFIFILPRQLTNRSIHSLALALPKLESLSKIEIQLIGFNELLNTMTIANSTILQFFSGFQALKNLTDITFNFTKSKI